ncbi:MAG: hypothetical protein JW750_11080 [Anaerolineaceae bacterium]|nr:hypothetical protein [Anaerolineaceae bacterium]
MLDQQKLVRAIALVKQGDKETARELLEAITTQTPEETTPWFWLVECAMDEAERKDILLRCRSYHPENEQVRKALTHFGIESEAENAVQEQLDDEEFIDTPEEWIDEVSAADLFEPLDEEFAEEALVDAAIEPDEKPAADQPAALKPKKKPAGKRSRRKQRNPVFLVFLIVMLLALLVGAVYVYLNSDQLLPAGEDPAQAETRIAETIEGVFAVTRTMEAEATREHATQITPEPSATSAIAEEAPLGGTRQPTALIAPTATRTPEVPEGGYIPLPGGRFCDLAWSSDGTYFAIASDQGIYLFDGVRFDLLRVIHTDPSIPVRTIAFSYDERLIAAGFDSTALNEEYVTRSKVWNVADGAEIRDFRFNQPRGDIVDLAFTLDGERLLAEARYDQVLNWRFADAALVDELPLSNSAVDYYGVAFAPDRRSFASYSLYDDVRVYDVVTEEQISRLGNSRGVSGLLYAPNSQLLAASYADESFIRIWDVPAEEELRVLNSFAGTIRSMDFDAHSRTLAALTDENFIKFWDLSTGQEMRTMSRITGDVEQIRFSPDNAMMAARSQQVIQIWMLNIDVVLMTFQNGE